jgi:hypothetical protein
MENKIQIESWEFPSSVARGIRREFNLRYADYIESFDKMKEFRKNPQESDLSLSDLIREKEEAFDDVIKFLNRIRISGPTINDETEMEKIDTIVEELLGRFLA